MKSKVVGLLAVGLLAGPMSAGAVRIGDKDWRQLAETVNFTWNEINSVCSSGLCSGGTGALATFNGWRWADYDQVSDLLLGLADGPWTECVTAFDCFFFGQSPDIEWAMTQFAPTVAFDGFLGAYGWTRTPYFQAVLVDDDIGAAAAIGDFQSGDERLDVVGVWLYRPVPEPSTLALLGLGLAGLGLSRRRKEN
jgi:hypothetical protein